jgi:hypothetical protein
MPHYEFLSHDCQKFFDKFFHSPTTKRAKSYAHETHRLADSQMDRCMRVVRLPREIVELVKPWSALFHYAWNSGEERMASVLDSVLLAYLQRS